MSKGHKTDEANSGRWRSRSQKPEACKGSISSAGKLSGPGPGEVEGLKRMLQEVSESEQIEFI